MEPSAGAVIGGYHDARRLSLNTPDNPRIAVIGLGYVGLPPSMNTAGRTSRP